MHIDMDAYYAAVEEKLLPVLRDKPVVVGGSGTQRGIATTASYAAREYGVHSAMPLRTAAKLCPDAIFISSSHGAYAHFSKLLFDIFERFTPKVEPTSVDEAFLEVTGMQRHYRSPVDLARDLKTQVRNELGLTCSVGIAPSKLVAKMASSQHKPDGLYWVDPEHVTDWLAPQPVGNLWGVGKKTEQAFARMGIGTIGELQKLTPDALSRRFGKWGDAMYQMARGIDRTPVLATGERPAEKSMGHEHTFSRDTADPDLWHATLLALSDMVARRLRQGRFRGRTITLKFRTDDFHTTTHADSLPMPTDNEQVIFGVVCRLLNDLAPRGKRVRLLGVSVSNLTDTYDPRQCDLFASPVEDKQGTMSKVVDRIRDRFGRDAIGRLGAHF